MNVLLDADMLLFQCAVTAQQQIEWEDDIWLLYSDAQGIANEYWAAVGGLCDLLGCLGQDVTHFFTDKSQFRRDIFPAYKTNRKTPKPLGYKAVRAEILSLDNAYIHVGFEADDGISVCGWADHQAGRDFVVVSGDKDMAQVPGRHIWPWTDTPERQAFTVTPDEAELFTWRQALVGDPGDGYPGCPGIGPVKADKLLEGINPWDEQACWKVLIGAYEKAKLSADYAVVQYNLARLLRPGQIDRKGDIKLCQPPSNLTIRPSASSPTRSQKTLLQRCSSSSRSAPQS